MSLIAIDMTPARPGGENGGVKLLALELIKGFQAMASNHRFLLLTASWNDRELSSLDSANTQRLCVLTRPSRMLSGQSPLLNHMERKLRNGWRFLRSRYRDTLQPMGLLSRRGVDVLFCPFTAPTYAERGVRVVSVICDLQHRDYPHFFTADELYARDAFLAEVRKKVDAVVCISESTRESVIRHLKTAPDKTFTVPICIQSRLAGRDLPGRTGQPQNLPMNGRPYMFYPANYWPHKNHLMLIAAYGMYLSRHPDSAMDLVFTGALDEAQKDLQDKVRRMGLERRIHFLGYLPDAQLLTVWKGCSLLIFPSLYEGFGIPVLEAMQFGKPVLCSNVTSLPEVAGDAAIYFDPRKPGDMVRAMEEAMENPDICKELVRRGAERLAFFQPREMVQKYMRIIEGVMVDPRTVADEVEGIYNDGWTGGLLEIAYAPEPPDRVLELTLDAPEWAPYKKATVRLRTASGEKQHWTINRGEQREIRLPLSPNGNRVLFSIAPGFVPAESSMGSDDRQLGVQCKECRIVDADGRRTTLWPRGSS